MYRPRSCPVDHLIITINPLVEELLMDMVQEVIFMGVYLVGVRLVGVVQQGVRLVGVHLMGVHRQYKG